ncbi:hypothetical protein CJ179_36055 [Rhodococcus sp. ACS1]|nr:hypothetical protein CJ179_36055 [Rhodococcus sp. ACS1]
MLVIPDRQGSRKRQRFWTIVDLFDLVEQSCHGITAVDVLAEAAGQQARITDVQYAVVGDVG